MTGPIIHTESIWESILKTFVLDRIV